MHRYLILIGLIIPTLFLVPFPSLMNAATPSISVQSTNKDQVGLYEKFEAVLLLQGAVYQNPYDPDEIDVRAIFSSPTGKTWEIFGFYDNYNNRDQWKVRFSPNEIGDWKYTLQASDGYGTGYSQEYIFKAVASQHHGWLQVSERNPHYLAHDDGTSYYGVGVYLPWSESIPKLDQLQKYGANFWAIWNTSYGGFANSYGFIENELGRYNQPKCGRLDSLLTASELRGLYLMLCIWPHDLFSNTVWAHQWDQNPYHLVCDVKEVYSDATAWEYQEKLYRYLIARFAYSRSLAIWEIMNEIDGTDGYAYGQQAEAIEWVRKVDEYLNQNDPFRHPTTASLSGGFGQYRAELYNNCDMPNRHVYEAQGWPTPYAGNVFRSSTKNYADATKKFWDNFEKPGLFGETGATLTYYNPNTSEYTVLVHNALWASVTNGLALTPVWWAYSDLTSNDFAQYSCLAKFTAAIDFVGESKEHFEATTENYDLFGMKGDSTAFGWIRDIDGNNVSEQLLILEGLHDASYSIMYFNTWTGEIIKTNYRLSQNGQMIDQIPSLAQNLPDIAFKIQPAANGNIPQRLELIAYPTELYADTSYTSKITGFVLDAQDRICLQASNSVTFTLDGPGTIEGTNPIVANNGVANIIFRANDDAGTARIIASSSGLVADTVSLVIQKFLYIDDFENYSSDADLANAWQKRYGTDANVFLESSVVGEGQKAMRLEYKIGDGSLTYAGIARSLVGDWSKANFLTFWLKPYGTGHTLTIRLYVDNTRYWYYIYAPTGSDAATITIPLNDFKANYSATYLDRTALVSMALYINQGSGNWGSGTLYFDDFRFLANYTAVMEEQNVPQIPENYELYQNYPNPFNNATIISYAFPRPGHVRIAVYNIQGQLVEVLVDKQQEAGIYRIQWNTKNISTGIYFYRMEAQGMVQVRKAIVLK